MSTEGKTVTLTEENKGKLRLFRNRDPFDVEVPKEVSEFVEDCPVSITITPMTHREAEVRSRIKKKLHVAQLKSNREAGILDSEVTEYHTELSDLRMNEVTEDNEESILELWNSFQKKWEDFSFKVKTKDMSEVWELEDELYLNTVNVVVSNCVSINWEDRKEVIEGNKNDFLHPDFFNWILFQIEDNSYLRENEISGLL